jgi:hypothetical protein
MGEAGALPHLPEDGKVVAIRPWWYAALEIASGVDRHGRLTPVAGPLDRPTSVAFSRRSAFVVTLTGKVLRIDGIGHRHW